MNVSRHDHEQNAPLLNQESRVPSLFELAVKACARNIQLFGTLEGLPLEPFGQAILDAFVDQQHQLSVWQRQVGILVYAESYGHHRHYHHDPQQQQDQQRNALSGKQGLVFSGLSHLSSLSELSLLSSFAECLVYLDLSAETTLSSRISLSDQDLVALAGMKQLRVLSLAGQENVGDIGLSYLINSAEFEVGLERLEYLNMRCTGLTDQGLARLWPWLKKESQALHNRQQQQQHSQNTGDQRNDKNGRCVWPWLLGIDISGTSVHKEVAQSLFANASRGRTAGGSVATWRQLPGDTVLFPPRHDNERSFGSSMIAPKQSCKLYVESDHTMDGEYHYPTIQEWNDALDEVHEKYEWVRIGVEDGEHRVSVADGLPALMAFLKMTSTHVQELPDDPPLQLYPTYSNNSSNYSPFRRKKWRGQRQEHDLIGHNASTSITARLQGARRRQAVDNQGLTMDFGHSRTVKMKQAGKRDIQSLIFVRDRQSVLEEMTHLNVDDNGNDGEEDGSWGSQATLVNPPTQASDGSWHAAAPGLPIARIRRSKDNTTSPLLLVRDDGSGSNGALDLVTMAQQPRTVREEGARPTRRKRVWVPNTAESQAAMTKKRSTGSTLSAPFVKVTTKMEEPDHGNDIFSVLSCKSEESPSAFASSFLFSPSSSWATSTSSKVPVPLNADKHKLSLATSKCKTISGVTASSDNRKEEGGGGQRSLLSMWVKKEQHDRQTRPLTSAVHANREKSGRQERDRVESDAGANNLKEQDFHFVDNDRKIQSSVSLARWLGGRNDSVGHATRQDTRSSSDQQPRPRVDSLSTTTLWMRRVHEEGMTLSRGLSMNRRDAKATVRQVLPGGVKVPVLLDTMDDDK
ncbi:hypothetical protein BGW42_008089 [Actinomortierella wolfii]|nr:hypothetical protein BGW42_008089 [Actinomortierella wolfii]